MAPALLGTRPRMARVRTDLPCPEAPTKPRISPRYTSRSSPFRMVFSPKPTSTPRTLMITSGFWSGMGWRLSSIASVPDGREEHGEKAIEHDDHEDGLHHGGGDVAAQGLGGSGDRKAFQRCDDADDERHEGCL